MSRSLIRSRLFYNQFRQLHRSYVYNAPTSTLISEKKAFQAVWPEVMDSLMTRSKFTEQPEVGRWAKKLLEYTVSGGKLSRGLSTVAGYRMMEEPENISEETLHSARVLGWCLEMVHAYLLVLDDVIDDSPTRRGKLCWYRQPNIGLSAINDALMVYQSAMEILDLYFGKTPLCSDLMRLIEQTILCASMGQHLDISSAYNKYKGNLDVFTMGRFNTIATYKTGFISFWLPILSTLRLVKNGKLKATQELSDICLELGRLLQFQDDYMDVYGDETITGKTGTDIETGKCTWLAVTALELCNESQRSIFKENYGSEDPEYVKRIKQLYDELQLPLAYQKYESNMYANLVRRINELPTEGERFFFTELLNVYYKRIH